MIQQRIDIPNESANHFANHLAGLLSLPDTKKAYPVLIICHDVLGNKDYDLIADLTNTLAQENFVTFRFDAFGHDSNSGKKEEAVITQYRENIKSVITFLKTIPQIDKEQIGLIGHGFGGNACILLDDLRVKAIATVGVQENLDRLSHDMIGAVETCAVPLLIFHGTADSHSPFEDARTLYQNAPNPTLEIIEEADHSFTHPQHRQYLIESIRNFFIRSFQRKRFER